MPYFRAKNTLSGMTQGSIYIYKNAGAFIEWRDDSDMERYTSKESYNYTLMEFLEDDNAVFQLQSTSN